MSGQVSAYALACGSVQRFEVGNFRVSLWNEHGVYHVRTHEFGGRGRIAWDSYTKLKDARREYAAKARYVKKESAQ